MADVTIQFLLTSLVIVLLPGPGALFTISAGVTRGPRASLVAAAGCTLGIVPHLAAAVTGTAALLRASGIAFETVKVLGVCYLLVLAWQTWRDRSPLVLDAPVERSAARVIGSAVLTNALNPKLAVFFLAFLPQFVPAGSPHQVGRMLLLSAVFMVMTFVVFAVYGLAASGLRRQVLGRPAVVRRMRQLFAASFAALGLRLAVEPQT